MSDREGYVGTLAARNVAVASGGFEGNPEMLTHYLGAPPVSSARWRGGYYNKGEGIRMVLACGAAPASTFSSYRSEPLDPRSGAAEALVMNFPYGVLVNKGASGSWTRRAGRSMCITTTSHGRAA